MLFVNGVEATGVELWRRLGSPAPALEEFTAQWATLLSGPHCSVGHTAEWSTYPELAPQVVV